MVVEEELTHIRRFKQFLRAEDRIVFDDLLNQCKLYASFASSMATPVKEVPLFMSMLFAQHKRITDLERRLVMLETKTDNETTVNI